MSLGLLFCVSKTDLSIRTTLKPPTSNRMSNINIDIEEEIQLVAQGEHKGGGAKETHTSNKHIIRPKHNDYYEWMGSRKEVRPITVKENLQWHTMSKGETLVWWIGTCIQMLTLTVLSLRTDRLVQIESYLKYHWKHYSG